MRERARLPLSTPLLPERDLDSRPVAHATGPPPDGSEPEPDPDLGPDRGSPDDDPELPAPDRGSPRDPVMEYVLKSDGFLEPDKMQQLFGLIDRPCFVGHTHWPGVHQADFRFVQATDEQREFKLDGPCIVNVGSVGQPRDGDPRSSFAVVDGDRVEIHRVPYDFRRTQAKILAAGLHPALAERLARGK